MKKVIYLLTMLMVLSLGSCKKSETREKLKNAISQMQSTLPIDLGEMGTITAVEYNDENNEITATVDYNDAKVGDISYIRNHLETAKDNIIMSMADDKDLTNAIIDAEASLKYVYIAKSNGESVELLLTPEDFKRCEEFNNMSDTERARLIVDNNIKITNEKLPMTVDEYTTLSSVDLANNKLIYLYDVTETNTLTLALLKEHTETFKQNLISCIFADMVTRQTMSNVRKAGYDVVYHYISKTSGDELTITIDNSELPL